MTTDWATVVSDEDASMFFFSADQPPSFLPSLFAPSLPHSITPSLHHSITPSLHHSLTPSLHHSITPSLHHSLTPSHHHSLTPSHHHILPPSIPSTLCHGLAGFSVEHFDQSIVFSPTASSHVLISHSVFIDWFWKFNSPTQSSTYFDYYLCKY